MKKRNVDNFDVPKTEGDDVHTSFLAQMEMLERVGFIDVDLYVKYHLWCIIGGRKGPPGSRSRGDGVTVVSAGT